MDFTFRALPVWPYAATHPRRGPYTFKGTWSNTLALLERELRLLHADHCIIAAGFREADLRLDGLPRSGAREPSHPGIEMSFDSPHGRLVYATDVCSRWEHNVRSIALGLESLRAVDRYGITRRGEQYAGWKQLGSGTERADGPNVARGEWLIEQAGSVRAAQRANHPDVGGDRLDFESVMLASRGRP